MKIDLEINNLTQSPIEKIPFEKIAQTVLERQAGFLGNKKVSLNLTWVDKEKIQELNRKHRKQDSPTDILSFSEFENLEEMKRETDEEVFLGELILCYHDIKEYSSQKRVDLKQEIINVFIHGLLHLLGFDHEEEMFIVQEGLASEFFKK